MEIKGRGYVPEFGFLGPDTTKVMLGELPGMPTPQFSSYATKTIVEALSLVSGDELRNAVEASIGYALEVNKDNSIRSTRSPFDLPRAQNVEVRGTSQISDDVTAVFVNADPLFLELGEAFAEDDNDRIQSLLEEYFLALNHSQESTMDYPENPFKFEDGEIVMEGIYFVDPSEFAKFAIRYIGGGLFGWDSRGIPDYADGCLTILKGAIES